MHGRPGALLAAAWVIAGCGGSTPQVEPHAIAGMVRSEAGQPLAGAIVLAVSTTAPMRVSTLTGGEGGFELRDLPDGAWRMVVERPASEPETLATVTAGDAGAYANLRLPAPRDATLLHASAWWLGAFPDDDAKRRFILDCTGCHQFNETRVNAGGERRTEERWREDIGRMLAFAGPSSGFPVIAAGRDPDATARWLVEHLGDGSESRPDPRPAPARATITEYDLPAPLDLPHDVAIDSSGTVLATGMFTHVLWRIDPASGAVDSISIPVPLANPRALEIDSRGDWWVLLGRPMQVARRAAADGAWRSWPIGMYPHSIAPEPDGQSVWFNGHFTRNPELMGRLDPASGRVQTWRLPLHPTLAREGGPIPYEQRLAPDGALWMSELQGNRLVRLDPATGRTRVFEMPRAWMGPRRFDVGPDGVLWIPAYAGGSLVRFDPRTGEFREFALPIANALPYIARVQANTGQVWIGTAAADAAFRFDPATEAFATVPLPTRGATVRHLVIDPRTGDVWLAYGASPALHPARIARVRMHE